MCLGLSDLLTRHNFVVLPANCLPSGLAIMPLCCLSSWQLDLAERSKEQGLRRAVAWFKQGGEPCRAGWGASSHNASWQVPWLLSDRAQLLCIVIEERPPRTTVRGKLGILLCLLSLSPHSAFSPGLQMIHPSFQGASTGCQALC